MKKRPTNLAFTLLELMTVLAVIVILTGMVVGVAGLVQRKSAMTRAKTEIEMLSMAAERYKSENGSYPRTDRTDKLSPMEDFQPTKSKYSDASLDFYKELTGDTKEPCDGIPEADSIQYLKEFDPRILKKSTTGVGTDKRTQIGGFQDPFGFPYGYSTAAADKESEYLAELKKNPSATRPRGAEAKGYNGASFDLWSTAGGNPSTELKSDKEKQIEQAKWVKNW
jgi:prepilin-type N-terminal cleavage/methylation domain-containing protein